MRRNIKNLIAVGILVSIINSSTAPVFATESASTESENILKQAQNHTNKGENVSIGQGTHDDADKRVLKLTDAINAAISNSDKFALKSKQITYYRNKEDLQKKSTDFNKSLSTDNYSDDVYDYPYDKLELQENQTKQSRDFMEDQISSDITNKYNDMVLKQIDIDKSKRNLELKKNDLTYLKGKLSLGMATENQVTDAEVEIKSLQDDITAKENALSDAKDYFKVLTDLDLKNTYILDYDVDYGKFKIDDSVEEYIDDKLNSYFEYDDKILDLTKDYLKDLKDEGIKDIMNKDIPIAPKQSDYITTDANGNTILDSGGLALASIAYEQKELKYYTDLKNYEAYLDGKYSYDESKVKLDDTKKSLKNILKQNYSTLLDIENKIDNLKEQVNSTNTKLKFAKAQVDMGLMLQNDYDKQVITSEELDTALRKLIYIHNNLRDSIQKPWILSN
ncbi:TolC family protein [Clostridium beijerinckii]|uniref:TolC family protein n=1 Tax=Clostridium beijerinckii TaxID=1520 RepID=UPI0022261682|nr:TolC family protein [Clostridium beijerinckii]UYZ38071.1 TolC family protein [Clostridium beijerinckii]